ncbi:unnamed protein product [Rotaria sordida]|uniref:RIB43A-like with coiled-coils protein 2 n=1 Tax=Rotaria sordida TaxID=392033 RepID=A0A813T6Y3_9BILA|nr:unnamed protein product [Rotaria sordida]CAF0838333.1 unnamed protein product [Rotaria sordida]
MFLLNLPINIKEQAAIERRRSEEKKRLSRIFNVKYRTIGIDKASLDEQVKERQYMKNLEKQRNDAFDREMINNDFKKILLEQEELFQKRQYAQELNNYRQLYQKPEHAKEWDLNDPNRLKQLTPIRINDNDSRLGPSSGQIFVGEDLQASRRKKLQQEQLKNDFNLQIINKTKKNREEYLANLLYDYKQMELYERSNKFEQIENECHRAIELATRNYNEILAHEARIRAHEQKTRQTEEQLAEIANTAFSDMLTENSKNLLDARSHIIVDRWKGMSQDQLDDIRHQQLIQISECQKIKNNEKCFDETWKQYLNAIAKQGIIIEQQIEEDKRQYNHYLANENKNLAKIQREREDYLNTILYRSAPTAAFYQQFNSTSR